MIKAKWLYSELPVSLSQLSKMMKDNQYTESSGRGFLLSTSTVSKLSGKFIEKVVQKSVVEDPFGQTLDVESISYYVCNFNWISNSNYMYISEPPRSLRKFVNELHHLTGFGLVLSEVNISPEQWLKAVEGSADVVTILEISSYGIRTSQNSTAKVSVGGTSDIRAAFIDMMRGKRYLVDSVKFKAEYESLIVKGELTKTGICRLKSSNTNFILEKLRGALEKA